MRSNEKVLQLRFKGEESILYAHLVNLAIQHRDEGEPVKGAVHRLAKMVLLDFVERANALPEEVSDEAE